MNKFDIVLNKYLKENSATQADTALSNPTLTKALQNAATQGGTQTKQALDALGKSLETATEPTEVASDPGHAVLKDLMSDSQNNHIDDALKSSNNKQGALESLTKMGLQPIPQTNNQQPQTSSNTTETNPVAVNQQQKTNNTAGY